MCSLSKSTSSCSSTDEEGNELRRGPWTVEEDALLIHYISSHGEGRWNLLAKLSGLKRTGKSCRLRWLNYLKPDVKRGNLTPQEQLLILQLHSKWGNRWSKIAQHLPGRTDNEIKNYWRTRVQKQARHLKIDSTSKEFQELIRCAWMPRLLQKIQLGSSTHHPALWDSSSSSSSSLQSTYHQALITSNSSSAPQVPYNYAPLFMNEASHSHHLDINYHHQYPTLENNGSSPLSISSSESTNISQAPGIDSGYNDSQAHYYNQSRDENRCYNVDNVPSYEVMEATFGLGSNYTVMGGSKLIDPAAACDIYTSTGENNWVGDELAAYGGLWNNLDEL